MDNLLLEGVVSELRPRLTGWPVFRIVSPAADQILVLFDDPERSRLLLSAAPDLPRLHLTSARTPRHENAASPFAPSATHHLGGAVLAAIEKEPADRIVRLRFAGPEGQGKSLIAELLGRSSNLIVTDRTDVVLAAARRLKSAFRAPVAGAPYEPPRGPSRRDPRTLTRQEIGSLAARSRAESHPLADLLLELCPALGPLAGAEIERRFELGEDPFEALHAWLDRAFGGLLPKDAVPGDRREPERAARAKGDPGAGARPEGDRQDRSEKKSQWETAPAAGGYVYADGPLGALDPRRALGPARLLLSPLPLVCADPDLECFTFPSLNEAADAFFSALASGRASRARLTALGAIASKEARRSAGIVERVARDLETMEQADTLRLYGEALLAGLRQADKRGTEVLVPDPYDAEGRTLAIPIDPAISLAANAERYFVRHRKAERGRAVAGQRLAAQSQRRDAFIALGEKIAGASSAEDLSGAEAELRALGLAVGLERRAKGAAPAEAPRAEGARVYKSSDGYEILVGKGAEENDRLTFKIASPEDFWLHASGASGAHVVVRNPRGEPRLPATTLREAAALAAFFSKAKDAGRAEVLVTRRKYVRRIRGAPRGTVTVKKKESLSVVPKNPFD